MSASVFLRSVPITENVPRSNVMSCSLASKRCAAIFLPLAMTLSEAFASAGPPTTSERDPYVPMPNCTLSVSPKTMSMFSNGTPSFFADNLGECCLVTLAVIVRSDQHSDLARRVDANSCAFVEPAAGAKLAGDTGGGKPTGFHISAHTDAAQLALPRRLRLTRGEAYPVREVCSLRETSFRVAAVILHHHGRLVGIGFLRDHVAAANLDPVNAYLGRRDIDQPLKYKGRLRPSSAAIGVNRHGVSEDHLDLAVDGRGGVDAGKQWAVKVGGDVGPERRDVAAEIGDGLDPQPEKLAVGVEPELGLGDVIAAVSVRHESFAPLADPLDRPPDLAAGPGHNGLFGVVELLHAESAADIGGDHPQLLLRDVEHEQAHEQPHHMRKLACRPKRIMTSFGMKFRNRRPRLHRVTYHAVVHKLDAGDVSGPA